MEVIIGLYPARCASPPHRHTPAEPTFRFPSPVKTLDLLSSLNRLILRTLRLWAQIAQRNARQNAARSAFSVSEGEHPCAM